MSGKWDAIFGPAFCAALRAGEINRELDRLDAKRAKLNDLFISSGRGNERASEIEQKTDPLARQWQAVTARAALLRAEIERRYGPGAPRRLPRGFGPIKS